MLRPRFTIRAEPALLTGDQMRAGRRYATLYSCLSIVFWLAVNERVISLFVLRLDPLASDTVLAFFFALTPLAAILTALMSPVVDVAGKKRIMVPFYWCSTVLLALMILIPWTRSVCSAAGAVRITAVVMGCYAALRALGFPGWFPILDDNVPGETRGRFFGTLRTQWQTVLVVATALGGLFLGSQPELWRFQVLLAVAVLASILGNLALMAVPEAPVRQNVDREPFIKRLAIPFRNRVFANFLIFGVLFSFAAACVGPITIRCLKSTLHVGDGFVVWMDTLAALGAALTLRFWGNFVDRFGARTLFALLLPPLALINLLWLLVASDRASWSVLLAIYFVVQGVLTAGIGVGITDMMLGSAEGSSRSAYMNIAFVCNTVAAGLAPFAGAKILHMFAGVHFQAGLLILDATRLVFLARVALMLLPLLLLNRLSRRHGGHVGQALQQISGQVLAWLPIDWRRADER
ncbi:MAG: MFS transporter [Verrucomicrobiota bacterium]|jgi:MFS family permease